MESVVGRVAVHSVFQVCASHLYLAFVSFWIIIFGMTPRTVLVY